MRRHLLAALLLLCTAAFLHGDESLQSGPQPGTRNKPTFIPSSFQVWMVTGPRALRYHSPVCEHGLNPVALIFLKDFDESDKVLIGFLKKLDELMAKHPDARFGCCAVVLNDGGFRDALEKDDDNFAKRLADTAKIKDDLETKLQEVAKGEKMDHLAFCLDTKAGPKDFKLNDDAAVTIVFYNKHIVLKSFGYKEKLTEADVAKLFPLIEDVVLETERLSRPGTKAKPK